MSDNNTLTNNNSQQFLNIPIDEQIQNQRNTMQSNVSDMLAQNQKNLQHLYSLQSSIISNNNALNSTLTNNNTNNSSDQEQIPYYLQLQQAYNDDGQNNNNNNGKDGKMQSITNSMRYNSVTSNGNGSGNSNRYNSINSVGNRYNSITSNNNNNSNGTNGNNNNSSRTPTHSLTSNIQFQGKNSLTSASIKSRARSSFQRQKSKQLSSSRSRNKKYDPKNPLLIIIPYNAKPTEILASRFDAWRNVIKSLITYLTETASIQDEIVRQQLRLTHAIQFPFFSLEQHDPQTPESKILQKFFLPLGHGSIQDLPTILNQYHGALATNASKMSKELTNDIIPRLEYLRRDLLIKIKEIKLLESDFKNNCSVELLQTKDDMKRFQDSIKDWNDLRKVKDIEKYINETSSNDNNGSSNKKYQDPYITKLILDKQIKKQISEENFLHEAFDNLESSGCELEKVVVMEIQNALTIYAKLLGQQSQLVFDSLISRLDMGFFSKDPQFEWDDFIERDTNFIELDLSPRKFQMMTYNNQFDPFTYEIRSGFLEKRSKFLKSYSKGFFVLTPCYLHEFKTADRKKDLVPVLSLNLLNCTITENIKKDSNESKFILHEKQNGLIKKSHNWVFKTDSHNSMMQWFQDLKTITQLTNIEDRKKYVCKRLNLDENGKPIIVQKSTSKLSKHHHHSTGHYNSPSSSAYTNQPSMTINNTNSSSLDTRLPESKNSTRIPSVNTIGNQSATTNSTTTSAVLHRLNTSPTILQDSSIDMNVVSMQKNHNISAPNSSITDNYNYEKLSMLTPVTAHASNPQVLNSSTKKSSIASTASTNITLTLTGDTNQTPTAFHSHSNENTKAHLTPPVGQAPAKPRQHPFQGLYKHKNPSVESNKKKDSMTDLNLRAQGNHNNELNPSYTGYDESMTDSLAAIVTNNSASSNNMNRTLASSQVDAVNISDVTTPATTTTGHSQMHNIEMYKKQTPPIPNNNAGVQHSPQIPGSFPVLPSGSRGHSNHQLLGQTQPPMNNMASNRIQRSTEPIRVPVSKKAESYHKSSNNTQQGTHSEANVLNTRSRASSSVPSTSSKTTSTKKPTAKKEKKKKLVPDFFNYRKR